MRTAIEHGLPSLPWTDPRAAPMLPASMSYLHSQAEAGTGCPLTMTFASVPALRCSRTGQHWLPKILATNTTRATSAMAHKAGVTIGMAMTEKQGGTDARQHHPRLPGRRGRARPTNWWGTSGSARRRCAMPS
jgi:putative acyl-CoA dehydrogenase